MEENNELSDQELLAMFTTLKKLNKPQLDVVEKMIAKEKLRHDKVTLDENIKQIRAIRGF